MIDAQKGKIQKEFPIDSVKAVTNSSVGKKWVKDI